MLERNITTYIPGKTKIDFDFNTQAYKTPETEEGFSGSWDDHYYKRRGNYYYDSDYDHRRRHGYERRRRIVYVPQYHYPVYYVPYHAQPYRI